MSDELACPKCGGRLWDNRTTKKNPRAPDYKCRDTKCDGVVWPPREGTKASKPVAAPRPVNAGPLLPNESGEEEYFNALTSAGDTSHLPHNSPSAVVNPAAIRKAQVEAMYMECLSFIVEKVLPVWSAGDIPFDGSAINAAVATVLIQRVGR